MVQLVWTSLRPGVLCCGRVWRPTATHEASRCPPRMRWDLWRTQEEDLVVMNSSKEHAEGGMCLIGASCSAFAEVRLQFRPGNVAVCVCFSNFRNFCIHSNVSLPSSDHFITLASVTAVHPRLPSPTTPPRVCPTPVLCTLATTHRLVHVAKPGRAPVIYLCLA